MTKKKKNDKSKSAGAKKNASRPVGSKKKFPVVVTWLLVVLCVLVAGRLVSEIPAMVADYNARQEQAGRDTSALKPEEPALSLQEIQERKLIVDVHEHIGTLEEAATYLDVMDELGIGKMCLMGSSKFTLTLNESYGFTGYDENNAELIKIIRTSPGRFEAWPTVNPEDPKKLEKFKALVEQGASGLKLYTGHGYTTKQNEYMFHPIAMDDPRMMPLYAYCEENFIPVCIHVNPYKGKPGFAQEFIAVLSAFPDMKVDCPHFMLSSIMSSRLREYLDTFPNLYTDISFGDFFMKAGLTRISRSPEKFKKIFNDYPDRIMYAADLVLIDSPRQDREWVYTQLKAYLDMLSKETYTTPAIPGQTLNGLALPDWILERVLYKNFEALKNRKPRGTEITREINWDRMNVTPLDRKPGQTFPPPPKKKK